MKVLLGKLYSINRHFDYFGPDEQMVDLCQYEFESESRYLVVCEERDRKYLVGEQRVVILVTNHRRSQP